MEGALSTHPFGGLSGWPPATSSHQGDKASKSEHAPSLVCLDPHGGSSRPTAFSGSAYSTEGLSPTGRSLGGEGEANGTGGQLPSDQRGNPG